MVNPKNRKIISVVMVKPLIYLEAVRECVLAPRTRFGFEFVVGVG